MPVPSYSDIEADNILPLGPPNPNLQEQPAMSTADFFSYAYSDRLMADDMPAAGTKSLFNEYAVFRYSMAGDDYTSLYDKNSDRIRPPMSTNPTVSELVRWSQDTAGAWSPFGSTPYGYADFMYCKYVGLIPNNYLVTLRRFPIPMLDNLKTHDDRNVPPIAQAVTWLGEEAGNRFNEVFKFAVGINFKEIEAGVQEVDGNEKGFDASPLAGVPGGNVFAGIKGFLNPKDYSGQSASETDYAQRAWGSNGPYANKVYGPVNVIDRTMARGRGLQFEQNITVKFSYQLKSIGSINPKMAMLDLMSNFLTLTYNNAKFWGGAIRYFPHHPNVGFFGDQDKFYSGNVDGYIDSVVGELKSMGNSFLDAFSKLLQDPLAALQNLAKGGAKFAMGKIAAKDRPQILAFKSLLTGQPVGEWHMVVGNPMNPTLMIGNLVCVGAEFEFSDDFGADDFPSEMHVTVKMKHGRPRDKGDIESMFNLGNGRMYFGIKDDQTFSSTANSNADTAVNINQEQRRVINQNAGNMNSPNNKSMWGSKFTPFEYEVAKTWYGSAPATGKKKE